jgi:putative oxidoreductase
MPREESMSRILGRYADAIYALLRFVAGFMFIFHGLQKHFGAFGGQVQQAGTLPWFAGAIELVCGILILLGLLASWAAFLASGEMAAAYFMVHQPQGNWPIQNQGELAVLYCFVFLYIAARGSGPFSVARALRKPALD